MKQIISMLLSLVMVMSAVCVSAATPAEEKYDATPIFEETFATNTTSTFTFSKDKNDNALVNVNYESDGEGGYYLTAKNPDNTNRGYVSIATPPSSLAAAKYIKLELDMMLNQKDKGIAVAAYNTSQSTRSNVLDFSVDGVAGRKEAPYKINDWNHIEIYFDLNEIWTISYVNGVLAESMEIPSFIKEVNGETVIIDTINNFRFMLQGATDPDKVSPDTVVSIDNVKIYTVSGAIEPEVIPGSVSIDYVSVFSDGFGSYDKDTSLASVAAFGNNYGYGAGAENIKKIVVDPDEDASENYVLMLGATGTKINDWSFKRGVLESKDAKFHENTETYFSFRFYPTSDITRTIRMQGKDNGASRPVGKFDSGKVSFIDRSNSSNPYIDVGNYTLNEWNTLTIRLKKKTTSDTAVDGTIKVNNGNEVNVLIDCWDNCLDYINIQSVATADSTFYIDDFVVGKVVSQSTPDITTYPNVIIGQGDDSAVIFSSYEATNGVASVIPVIASYNVEDGVKTLIEAKVLNAVDATSGPVQFKGRISTTGATEYKVFFFDNMTALKPIIQSKPIER